MKRIVVCCDGTWNDPNDKTNVWKITQVLAQSPDQPAPYYDKGVGADSGEQILGGGFGQGLSKNIREAYRHLVLNYDGQDQIFLFGFSRGAFTVRSLVGFIRAVGLLRPEDVDAIDQAFEHYRSADGEDADSLVRFREQHRVRQIQQLDIHFLGVWDTVGALGIPAVGPRSWLARRRWKFHDYRLSSYVKHACQALAIDEKRTPFLATLWEVRDRPAHGDDARTQRRDEQRVEQRWFSGCHSDIGGAGGRFAFEWMVGNARQAGLEFDDEKLRPFLPDPVGVQTIHESLSPWYRRLTGAVIRPVGARLYVNQNVDQSARRKRDGDDHYRPINLERQLEDNPMQRPRPIMTTWLNRFLQRRYLNQYEQEGRG